MTLVVVLGLTALLVPLAWWLGNVMGRSAGWPMAAALLGSAGALTAVWTDATGEGGERAVSQVLPWMPDIGVALALRMDGLSYFFGMLVLVIGAVVLAYSARYLGKGGYGSFYGLMTFFAAAMLGLVLADDLVMMYVTWEFTTVCSFLLISRSGPAGTEPAIRTFLVTVLGGLGLLTTVAIAWVGTGTTRLSEVLVHPFWGENPALTVAAAMLVALAAFTKSAQFPFHGWLPDAMVAITPVSAYLHAAAMVKAGIFLLLRFSEVFAQVPAWNALLIGTGLLTALMGAVFALQRRDLKGLLAYSTVSQLGFLVATIGIGTTYAIAGAVVHTAAHALFKSALFMSVGVIDHEAGTRDIRELSGLGKSMPVTATIMVLATASMAGIPPLFGFVSKEAMFKAASEAHLPLPVVVLIGGVMVAAAMLTFAYSCRMLLPFLPARFGGRLTGEPMEEPPREGGFAFVAPVAVVALAGVVLGLAGPLAEPLLTPAAQAVMGPEAETDLALWHGVNPALFMSIAVILGGIVLVALRERIDTALDRRLLPFTAVGVVDLLRDGAISFGQRVGNLTRSDSPYRHLVPPLAMLVLLAAGGLVIVPNLGEAQPVSHTTDWALLALVALSVVLAGRARTRISMVAIVGVAGFAMSLYYFSLGAVDVAFTQLMVEILTVVVIVLVLNRLPGSFHRTPRRHAWVGAVLGVLTGAAAGLATLAFTGSRGLSELGHYFLAEAEALTGGTNVVNTILVDFRALDTLGELTVLGMAGIAVIVALDARGLLPYRPDTRRARVARAATNPLDNGILLRTVSLIIGPLLVGLSIYYFLRGHYSPGGGFNSALVLGAGISLIYLAAPADRLRLPQPYVALIGWGIVVAIVVGLVGYLDGSFLRPLHSEVGDVKINSALVFDLGVYFAVAGVVLATVVKLGTRSGRPPLRHAEYSGDSTQGPGGTVDKPHHPDTTPHVGSAKESDRAESSAAASHRATDTEQGGQ